ncbi:hemerythrin domain-containing protein [Curvibacter sp. RS43]|uniref:Hemerythrin domain-containing protein n=1 Tax=Curvibacter microcysteis TaxID=3026419 RepID=A0ABT5MBI6_9BURK|nr:MULTISPECIES: hemerythrin domain-containing protein [unclassified Curvibacter]MDD0811088.1 hemerythrin domain-containing protein [Curvibacter sp. RS43]MDD0813941.1 hemerythrin domain-containing protein [Curvibacter sp. HBC28]
MAQECIKVIQEEHTALAAMLRSMLMMLDRGPGDEPEGFFDVMRAMLFYIDEFPEKQHHPKESDLLFPRVARHSPHVMTVVEQLEREHMKGEAAVRELQHLLLAWELMGEGRRARFEEELRRYVGFYLDHMRLEESVIIPEARKVLNADDWKALDEAFLSHVDPLANPQRRDPAFDRLFTRIVMRAPSPVGLG